MVSTSDSSSDEDIYVSSVARLKALKKKSRVVVIEDSPTPTPKGNGNDSWSSKSSEPPPISERRTSQNSADSIQSNGSQRTQRAQRRSAKRANTIDVPEEPIVSPVIVLDDDSDDAIIWEDPKDKSLNLSQDTLSPGIEDENYNLDIKVRWRSRKMVRLELRKYEPFQKIFQYFANLEGVSEKQILLLRGGRAINRTDTPASLELTVLDFLEGGIVNAGVMTEQKTEDTGNVCKIKVQMSTKQKINVDLKMNETFKTVVMNCAEQLGVSPAQIKLCFDGDDIALTDTPESLDLEQEACIDLRVVGP